MTMTTNFFEDLSANRSEKTFVNLTQYVDMG